MNETLKSPIKKESKRLTEILQGLSILVLSLYIILYVYNLISRETPAFDLLFIKHLFYIIFLLGGLIISRKNTLITGLIYLLFCVVVSVHTFGGNIKLEDISTEILDILLGLLVLVLGVLFLVSWFIKKSKWD